MFKFLLMAVVLTGLIIGAYLYSPSLQKQNQNFDRSLEVVAQPVGEPSSQELEQAKPIQSPSEASNNTFISAFQRLVNRKIPDREDSSAAPSINPPPADVPVSRELVIDTESELQTTVTPAASEEVPGDLPPTSAPCGTGVYKC